MIYMLLQKREPNFIITKSLNQYPNINAHTSDETEPKKIMETALLFLMICCYRNQKAILICFSQEVATAILMQIR